jgi:hypothetical protein
MIGWTVARWLSTIAVEVPRAWLKLIGPMTWVLLLLAPASLTVLGNISSRREAAQAPRLAQKHRFSV